VSLRERPLSPGPSAPPDAPLPMPMQSLGAPAIWPAPRPAGAATIAARHVAAGLGVTAAAMAGYFYLDMTATNGIGAADLARAALIVMLTGWLAWGAALALLGLFAPPRPRPLAQTGPIDARVVVLIPVHNEDPSEVMAGIVAMDASLAATGCRAAFDFAVLSDTTDPDLQRAETAWTARLLSDRPDLRLFYRHRARNTGRKAGNIADFLRRSGAAWDFAIVLDADSLMEGETLVQLVRRIAADPGLGLLQTLPIVTGAQSRFARLVQFTAALHSPIFARGLAAMQGGAGPYWGHNAIFRIRAFAESCGLPDLPGRAPLGGTILSHDHVEAALLVRAGWRVRIDPDLGGSFERTPETLVDHAARDRRWCQGNLQHTRLLAAPGLAPWSRLTLALGSFSYLAPLLWLAFVALSLAAPLSAPPSVPGVHFEPSNPVPIFAAIDPPMGFGLLLSIFGLLILPKLLIALAAVLDGRARGFGGPGALIGNALAEIVLTALLAPILLVCQARAALEVVLGRDSGWPAQRRGAVRLTLRQAWRSSHWIVALGLGTLLGAGLTAPGMAFWLAPVALPLVVAPLTIALTSRGGGGAFATPADICPASVLIRRARILDDWRERPLPSPHSADDNTGKVKVGGMVPLSF
jgi:membrane glycosyltransferase